MSHFPAPHSEPVHEDWTRVLVKDWTWRTQMRGKQYQFYVPAGVEYDPSQPTWAEAVIPEDRLQAAALIHDVIYKMQGCFRDTSHRVVQIRSDVDEPFRNLNRVTRRFADDTFRKILEVTGVASWRIWLAYRAIRWFGGSAWREEDDFQLPT